MPSTGTPSSKMRRSAGGASLSYTDHGAPESTMPTGAQLLTSSSEAVQGSTTEKTFCSRMRRAISCVNCEPKSRMTMDSLRNEGLTLDWVSTDEFLKSDGACKGLRLRRQVWHVAEDRLVAVNGCLGRRGRQWRGFSQ